MRVRTMPFVLALVIGMLGAVAGAPVPASAATVVAISHSNSMAIVVNNSVACTADNGETTVQNSFFRVFDLADFGIDDEFRVRNVDFGVETLQPVAAAITVNLYTLDGAFVWANLTPIGSSTETLQPAEQFVHTMAVEGVAPAGSTLVVEVAAPDLDGVAAFHIGSNAEGQTSPSYLASDGCQLGQPTNTAASAINRPQMHIAMQVTGEYGVAVGGVEVAPSPSNEGQAVSASAAFTPDALTDPSCRVDYGDGTGSQVGVIEDGVCRGPAHAYRDDQPGGYQVTVEVCDGESCDSASVQHMVANVAPMIDAIATNGPVSPGAPVTITVTATDPGVDDILMYSFDCDGDGTTYEIGPQPGNNAACVLDPTRASAMVNVLVEDGDGGNDTGSVTVRQSATVCASRFTGGLSAVAANGSCPSGSVKLSLPGSASATLCVSPYTGALVWRPAGACGAGHRVHVAPDDGPLSYCRSLYTGQLRYTATGQCGAYERPGVIPG